MTKLYTALLAAQKEFPVVKKEDSNPFFKSKYAGLPAVLEVVVPILNNYGIFMAQAPTTEDGRIGVTTTLTHAESGESVTSSFTMALAKNDPQGAGSAITYARRYALVSILGLNVDEDDDANHASGYSTPQKATKPPTTNANDKVCSLCGSEAKVSPKSGKDYCPNWQDAKHSDGSFHAIVSKSEKEFNDSLPVETRD